MRSGSDSYWAQYIRRWVAREAVVYPRDFAYGLVPGGVAVPLMTVGALVSRHALIVAGYGALRLGELALALTWRPPERMKPR